MCAQLTALEEAQLSLVPRKALASRRAMQTDISTIEAVFGLPIEVVPWGVDLII